MKILLPVYNFFRSYALATVLFVFLTIVTLFGTLDQVHLGLYGAVKKYFQSWFIASDLLRHIGIPLPIFLPGGLLLMILLFINMTLGAMVHVRKRVRGIPNLVTHFGILFLLVSGFVTFVAKNDGYVALFPGQASRIANSYKTWQLEILEFDEESKPVKAHIIPWERLLGVGEYGQQEFASEELPFSVVVDTFLRNAMPVPVTSPSAEKAMPREINGFKLLPRKKDKEVERNFPGCFVAVKSDEGGEEVTEVILSGISSNFLPGDSPRAAGFEYGGKQYGLQLVKTNWPIDYYIRLDKFIFEKHPGTDQPRNYESRVTRMTDLDSEGKKVAIRMNEPMRYGGFVVFQEQYGQDRETGEYFSQFAVSDNPSDQWPTIALTIMGVGLGLHFVWKLVEYLNKARNRRAKKA